MYLCDPGLRHAVASAPGQDRGRLAEAVVANRLMDRHPDVGFWQDGSHEVDFVVPAPGGRVDAYQVTFGDEIPRREAAAMHAFLGALPAKRRGKGLLLTRAIEGEVDGVPVWQWLLETD